MSTHLSAHLCLPCPCSHTGPCAWKAGYYHMSCFAGSKTAKAVTAAKTECIEAYYASNKGCAGTVVATGHDEYG